jgi:hypothetical protein
MRHFVMENHTTEAYVASQCYERTLGYTSRRLNTRNHNGSSLPFGSSNIQKLKAPRDSGVRISVVQEESRFGLARLGIPNMPTCVQQLPGVPKGRSGEPHRVSGVAHSFDQKTKTLE